MTIASVARALLARGLRFVADRLDPPRVGPSDDELALIEARRLLHAFIVEAELVRARLTGRPRVSRSTPRVYRLSRRGAIEAHRAAQRPSFVSQGDRRAVWTSAAAVIPARQRAEGR